jgi:hypothetical protein
MKTPRVPKPKFITVKITRPIVPADGEWRLEDETGEICEHLFPNRWLQEAMGARSQRYFLGRRGVDTGWELRQLKPHQARPVW